MTHVLKTVSPFYEEVEAVRKVHELRKADRDYQVGDLLHLRHYIPERDAYSGRSVTRAVTYILRGPWPEAPPADQVPCRFCGMLPKELPMLFGEPVRYQCPHQDHRATYPASFWIHEHFQPAINHGWCIMSMRPVGSQIDPISAPEAMAVLSTLVEAKDEKEASGHTSERYKALKVGLWEHARLLVRRNVDWLNRPMCEECRGAGSVGGRALGTHHVVRGGHAICKACAGTGRQRPPDGPTVGVAT